MTAMRGALFQAVVVKLSGVSPTINVSKASLRVQVSSTSRQSYENPCQKHGVLPALVYGHL